jgi:hypothetical protein
MISIISPNFTTVAVPQRLTADAPPPVASSQTDEVSLSGGAAASPTDARKTWKAVAWAGFGVEMIGGALTLTGHGPIGLALFAAGAAAIVVGEAKARRA